MFIEIIFASFGSSKDWFVVVIAASILYESC
jgi:hypothetical protein